MMMKKGQAAMEFMMTYGWAILVVLAAIGALAAFGVFDMGSMMPDKTTFPAPFINTESGTAQGSGANINVSIPFTNGMTKSINVTAVNVATGGSCGTVTFQSVTQADGTVYTGRIPTNAMFIVNFNCDGSGNALVPGDQIKMSDLSFSYNTDSGLTYIHSGSASITIAQ